MTEAIPKTIPSRFNTFSMIRPVKGGSFIVELTDRTERERGYFPEMWAFTNINDLMVWLQSEAQKFRNEHGIPND